MTGLLLAPMRFLERDLARSAMALASVFWLACAEEPVPDVPSSAAPSDGLVFLRPSADGAGVWAARISDGEVVPLVEAAGATASSPHWMSSLLRVVYLSRSVEDPTYARLTVVDMRTGASVTASDNPGTQEGVASVSPDGKRLAYAFLDPPGQVPREGVRVLDPMRVVAETVAHIPGVVAYSAVTFSPDSNLLAVQVYRRGRGDDIWIVGRGKRPLAARDKLNAQGPSFSHDGKAVFFTQSAYERDPRQRSKAGGQRFGGGDICSVALERPQLRCPIATKDAREFGVAASPTAAEIAYVREQGEDVDLFLAGLDGQNERRLTETPDQERALVWSPDGQRLAFEVGPPKERRIRVIDREGNVLFDQPGFAPDWAPPLF